MEDNNKWEPEEGWSEKSMNGLAKKAIDMENAWS